MNIVLVGYRGTGKTAVAALLAEQLGLRVVHLDAEIERKARKPIPAIVEERGWPGFRDLEEKVVETFASEDGQVIDCGGGVIEREANFDRLRKAGPVVWLQATPATIVDRIGGDDQRPSLTGSKTFTDEVVEVLQRRMPLYRRIAHAVVQTDSMEIEEVAEEVRKRVAEISG
jgi:shikimate kinase